MDFGRFWLLVVFAVNLHDVGVSTEDKTLKGAHLRVSTYEMNPFTFMHRDPQGRITFSGSTIDLVEWLSRKLNFTYETVLPDIVTHGWLENGTWTGVLGQLQRQEVDLVASLSSINSENKLSVADVTAAVGSAYSSLLIPHPVNKINLLATLAPFQIPVWVGVIMSLAAALVIMKFFGKYLALLTHFEESSFYFVEVICSQGGYVKSRKMAVRLLCGCWCLYALIITQVYNGTLVSHLTVILKDVPINSLQDLKDNPGHHLLTFRGSGTEADIMHSTVGKDLVHQQDRVTTINEGINKVLTEPNYVFAVEYTVITAAIRSTYLKTGRCQLSQATERFQPKLFYLLLPKMSPYKAALDQAIMRYAEMAFTEKSMTEITSLRGGLQKCYLQKSTETGQMTLSLKHLYSAFLIYAIGVALSALAFVAELFLCGKTGSCRTSADLVCGSCNGK